MNNHEHEIDNNENMLLNKQMQNLNILAFRGDNRSPKEIFEFGLQRKGSTWEHYNVNKKAIEEPTFRFFQNTWRGKEKAEDIIPTSAVCVTKNFDLAPLFPLENPQNENAPPPPLTWIYIVKVDQGFLTYELQRKLNSSLAFCEEIATRDIPSGDVICAIQCERFINIDPNLVPNWERGVHYKLTSDIIWNPKLNNEVLTPSKQARNDAIRNLIEQRKDKYWECPIPPNHNNKKSLTTQEISEVTHNDSIHLIQFAVDLYDSNTMRNGKMKFESALEHLKKCSDLNMIIPNMNETPLMHACHMASRSNPKNFAMVEYLLNNGANPDIKNSFGKTVMDYFLDSDLKLMLIEFKATKHNESALIFSIKSNSLDMVKTVLNNRISQYEDTCIALFHENKKMLDEPTRHEIDYIMQSLKKFKNHITIPKAIKIDEKLDLIETKLKALEVDIDLLKMKHNEVNLENSPKKQF